jgi:endoglucanase
MTFHCKRGTNISHWLSQSQRRGEARAAWFTEDDVVYIAGLGFDHIRIPVDEEQLWDETGRQEAEAFDLLDAALDWCARAGLCAIVDLHILRSHYFNAKETPPLFTDPAEEARFADLWRQLSARLGSRSPDLVAYELLNEAVAPDPEDWNRVAMTAFTAVRELEPARTIVLGSNWFNQYHTFEALAVPEDEHCILTFHYYSPMLITHYTAPWWEGGAYDGPVHYPGKPVAEEDLARVEDVTFRDKVRSWNAPYNRARMIADFQEPLAVRERSGRPLYCGEFGCYNKTPQPLRLSWYRDMIEVFNTYDIAWANWDYKGSFGIVTPDGEDTGIAAVLLET